MPKHSTALLTLRAAVAASALSAVAVTGCTDLTENPPSRITPSSFFQNDAQVQAALAGVYNGLRATESDYWNISQVSSDETIVPTRGTDWDDSGQWRELWTRSYGPASGAGSQSVNGAYSGISSGIAKANAVLDALSNVQSPAATQGTAEARALRAWFYYMLMDAFGGVPIITQPGVAGVPRASRDSVARLIQTELYAARPDLPASYGAGGQGRITQGAVDAILANLYLNWHIYTGTVTAAGLTPSTTVRYDSVIAVTDRIMNSGQYSLVTDYASWRANFAANNQGSKENIFVVRNQTISGLGLDIINRMSHYNHFKNPGGWNGFSILADAYNQFDPADQRRNIVLTGPQLSLDTQQPVSTRAGAPLVLNDITSLTAASEGDGYRVYKYTLDPAHTDQNMGNDFVIFRLGGVMLDRAEALYKTGNQAAALAILNTLRARVYSPPKPLSGPITDAVMLRERLTELTNEGKRRQDMIRLGAFLTPKRFETASPAPYTVLFPIPLTQLQANPALTQNPGYTQ